MGVKDHLDTTDESNKRQKRDFKKISSVLYQGNPPVFTEGLDQVGIRARTTQEVRDTEFPLLFEIDDQAQGGNLDEYRLDLGLPNAMYHRIIIGDEDEDTNPILNIDVFFDNLAKNKELQFTIEFVKDPAIVTDPTVTFSPPLENVPAGFPDDFDTWYFLISGRTLPDNTTRFELLNFGTGGGGGNTFPILYPEENLGTIGFITQIITVSGSDGQFKEITMNGDIDLAFAGLPAGTVLEEWWILFIQDNVGGHGLTSTGSTLKNAGFLNSLIDKTADARTLFHFATGDGGTSIHGDLVDLTAGGGGFSGNLSDLVIDVNKDWNGKSINNLAGLDLFANAVANGIFNMSVLTFISDAAASRGQIGRSDDFAGTADGLVANIMAGDNFTVAVDTTEKFRIDSALGQVRTDYDLNMKGNTIILDSDSDTFIDGSVDDVIDFATGASLGLQLNNTGFVVTRNTTIIGNLEILSAGFLSLLSGGQIFAGGAGVGMENIGNLRFVSNLATPIGIAIFSDGTFLKARSNSLVGNIMLNPQIEDLNMGIFNILSTNAPTGLNQFRIIFDGHEDSDTYFRNTNVNPDRIVVVVGGVNTATFSTSAFNLFDPIDMNTNDIQDVGNMDFGPASATSGRIRLPAGGGGAIKWESSPAGFDGEMYYDNDFNWFVDTGGEYKYFIGGFERFRIDDDIESFSDIDLNNNDLKGVQAIGFNDAGGQINVDLNVMQFVTTSPSAIMRFTPQANNTLDITEDGLIMNENIDLQNNNVIGINELQFAISGQKIFDGVNQLTIEVGFGDTIGFVVNGNTTLEINDTFCDFFDSFWDMTERASPFNPPVGQRRVFVNDVTGELSVRTATGSIISLEQGGAGGIQDRIVAVTGDAQAIVQASTFQVFTNSVERFNINPIGQVSILGPVAMLFDLDMNTNLIKFDGIPVPSTVVGEPQLFADSSNSDHLSVKSGDGNVIDLEVTGGGSQTPWLSDIDANNFKLFDISEIEFETSQNITVDDNLVLITSEFDPGGGNAGTEMIFNIPSNGFNNDQYKFYVGTFPNNPVMIVGRNRFRYNTIGTLSGSTAFIGAEVVTLSVGGNPLTAQIEFSGRIGSNIVPQHSDLAPFLTLGEGATGFINDAKYWKTLFVKNIDFQPFQTTNIHLQGNDLAIECGPALNRDIIFGRSNGQEFFRCTDDGDVFTPENIVDFTAEARFNNNVVLGSGASDLITIDGLTSINEDLNFDANRTIDWNVATFSPTATAGGGAATPATVLGFLFIKVSGGNAKIPFYGV